MTTVRPAMTNVYLGSISLPPLTQQRFKLVTSDTPVGKQAGYASLNSAREAAKQLTAGYNSPAAAIFADAGRYYLQALDARYVEIGPNGELYPEQREGFKSMEGNDSTDVGYTPYRRGTIAQQVVAIVDGDTSVSIKPRA